MQALPRTLLHRRACRLQVPEVQDETLAAPLVGPLIDDEDDEFGGDDLDEGTLVEAEISATQAHMASQAPQKQT